MKKNFLAITLLCAGIKVFSQIGINTVQPKATLDVKARSTDGSTAEGIIAPKLTGDQIRLADSRYGADQKGTIIYATAPVSTSSAKTAAINSEGYYYFDGNIWISMREADTSIYKNNGTLTSDRTVAMGDKILEFSSSSNTGTSHFKVDGNTLSIDAAHHRVGIGTLQPDTLLHIEGDGTNSPLKIDYLPSEPPNRAFHGLSIANDGTVYKNPRSSVPFYYQKYTINNVNFDWINNFDTKIESSKYTLVVVGNAFNHLLSVPNSNNNGRNLSAPANVNAFRSGSTWRLRADYSGASTYQQSTGTSPNGTWVLYTLIIDNSQINSLPDLEFNLSGSSNGAAAVSPVP